MSLLQSVSVLGSVRLGKVLTGAVLAFALASQGCAASTVTRSSSIEPVMNAAGTVGRGPDDSKTQSERPHESERHVVEHASALAHDRHGVRFESCRRCSSN